MTLRPRAVERIHWHQGRGDDVVVVSAALDVYLRPWCEAQGVQCICTELEVRNGLLTGGYLNGDCTGAEKVRRVVMLYPPDRYRTIYAYGDTAEDREMLELANRKYYCWREVGGSGEASEETGRQAN